MTNDEGVAGSWPLVLRPSSFIRHLVIRHSGFPMRHFHEQLNELYQKVVAMGMTAESMIQTAVASLIERNEAMAKEVFAKEEQVNALQVDIDDRAVKLTAMHQPVAQDARFLFMASRIGGELERVADQAINICQNAHFVLEAPPLKPILDLPAMADIAQRMVSYWHNAMLNSEKNV